MIPFLLFLAPAFWFAWLLGKVLREGLAFVLWHQPVWVEWAIANHDTLAWGGIALALLGNLLLALELRVLRLCRSGAEYSVTMMGGVMWLVGCLVQPGWAFAPLGGLGVFALLTMWPPAIQLARLTLRNDELSETLMTLVVSVAVLGGLHWGICQWLPN